MRWVTPALVVLWWGAPAVSVGIAWTAVYRMNDAAKMLQQCSYKVNIMQWHLQAAREMAPAQMREVDAYVDGVLAQMEEGQ